MFSIDIPTSADSSRGACIGTIGTPNGACIGRIESVPTSQEVDEAGTATTTTLILTDGTTADYEVYTPTEDVGAIATVLIATVSIVL